ncbi:LPS export ABC transporter periplasmic protein LptC [Marivirga sp. S37H4]|uniref:LPS export ABC transporter periplasmic protein LptC n=1 Tax=Marivirga aurantiaca TaxID=2802615 RepID=A0A934WZC5_9BACT|nr:LPS export ABC transporter periplasmic protein LptC [Marivirga aurantiaca]MBK6265550.1 LPS export ABC transporter periplasmic protein LptC [Marivirga aurantiaca]
MNKVIVLFIGFFFLAACSDDLGAKKEFEAYTGPIMEVDSATILYSDSAVLRVKINAPKQLEFENGDKEFPNTIFIEFFEPDGTLSSTLDAKTAYYTKETDIYKAEGDVEVIGYIEPQKMNSEELYWEPKKEEIYTEKFVRIETEDQISTGEGLVAKQDFSTYRILNPSGTIYLDESPSNDENSEKSAMPVRPTKDTPDKAKSKTQPVSKKELKLKDGRP